MAKDVNIHVKAKGTHQAERQLNGVARTTQGLGNKVNTSARKGAKGMDELSKSAASTEGRFAKFTSALTSWAAKLVGITAIITGVTRAIRAQAGAIKEHAQIAAEQQKALTELQYLGGFFKERPGLRKEVETYAEYGRRPFTEVASAWYNLRSKAGRLSPGQRQSILTESLELGRMYPSADLGTLVDMFSLYTKQTKSRDINQVQNVLQQTITEAGGGMTDVAKYMPQFLPIGLSGGLTGPQTAGLWAYVTTQLAEPSIATTGLKATFMGLQGRGTPESQKILKGLGVSSGMNFFEKMRVLASQYGTGKFGLAQAEQLAGREGAAVLLSMLADMPAMMETISKVTGAAQGGGDLTQDMIMELTGRDPFARTEEDIRGLDVRLQNLKGGDLNALRWQKLYKQYESEMQEGQLPEWIIRLNLGVMKAIAGSGAMNPFEAGGGAPVIVNDHSTHYYPRVGGDDRGPRADRNLR